ncbi:MAG: PaaI family thioesterase [Pseudomonadota bacterium]
MPEAPTSAGSSADPGADQIAEISRRFFGAIPWVTELGMELTYMHGGVAAMRVPYDARLVGDPATGVVHGGILTGLLDTTSGAAVMCHPSAPGETATIDLRIDYMRPARPGEAIQARAECYRTTRTVAFVRAVAYEDDPDDPVATAAGAFVVQSRPEVGSLAARIAGEGA